MPFTPRRCRVVIAVAALVLVAAVPARAQVVVGALFGDKLASPTFNLAFEIGLNFSTLDGAEGAARSRFPAFGLRADWRFSEHVHFTGALLPFAGRGAEDIVPVPTGDPELDDQTQGATVRRSLGYLDIPLVLHWAPARESGFRAGVGASLGIVKGGNDRYEVTSPSGSPYVLERDVGETLPGFDFGLALDAEWRFELLSIAVRYTHGLTDLRLPGEPSAVHTRTLTGTGRIALGRKKRAPPPPSPE